MARLACIFWLGLKEVLSLRRDAVMMALLIYSFTLAVVTEATGVSATVNNASIAFVDEDRSALSRALASAFFPPEFQPVQYIEAARMDPAMDAGRYLFIVRIPPRFEADIRASRKPEIQLLIDATAMEQAGIGANYIQNILAEEVRRYAVGHQLAPMQPVGLVAHSAFNRNQDTVLFQAVVSLINHITIMTIILTGAALIREREHGTIEHLLAMPLSPFDIAMAKICANGMVVLVAASLSMLVVVEWLLGVEIAGSRLLFFAGTTLYLFSATALGVFLATLARSMAQFALLIILTIMPMQLLSGADTPIESQPDWVQTMTLILPSRHYISFGQEIIYKGAGLAVVWPAFAAVTVLGLTLLTLSLALFRRSIAVDL